MALLEAGMDDYLARPFTPAALDDALRRALGGHEAVLAEADRAMYQDKSRQAHHSELLNA